MAFSLWAVFGAGTSIRAAATVPSSTEAARGKANPASGRLALEQLTALIVDGASEELHGTVVVALGDRVDSWLSLCRWHGKGASDGGDKSEDGGDCESLAIQNVRVGDEH